MTIFLDHFLSSVGMAGAKGDKGDAGARGPSGGGGGGLTPTVIKISAFTAAANDLVRIDSTAGAFTVTLPAGADGDCISILDVACKCAINNVLVAASGSDTVSGDPTGLNINIGDAYVPPTFQGHPR